MSKKEKLYNYWKATQAGKIILDCKILNDFELSFCIPNNKKRRLGIPLTRIPNNSNKKTFKERTQNVILAIFENYFEIRKW